MSIVAIYELAAKTFARRPNSTSRVLQATEFTDHFSKLIKLLSVVIGPTELGLDKSEIMKTADEPKDYHHPSATYIDVGSNDDFSIGIFVVHRGKKLPLHDHPGMHGILKCITGDFQITSYSACTDNQNLEIPPSLANHAHGGRMQPIPTTPAVSMLSPESPPCVLTPSDQNFHEIRAVGGCAAFLDILSPPYHADDDKLRAGEQFRDCNYLQVATKTRNDGSEIAWLVEASESEMKYFWTRTEKYLGPSIKQIGKRTQEFPSLAGELE